MLPTVVRAFVDHLVAIFKSGVLAPGTSVDAAQTAITMATCSFSVDFRLIETSCCRNAARRLPVCRGRARCSDAILECHLGIVPWRGITLGLQSEGRLTLLTVRRADRTFHIGSAMNSDETAAQKPLIACVDDDVSVREALGGLLGAFGYVVRTFESAEDFLASESFNQVTCLITDVQLGGISGLQLLRHLVAMHHLVPTIVITALSDDELRSSAMDAGASEFLTKPIMAEQLLSALRKILNRSAT